jgi:hypothetical protein
MAKKRTLTQDDMEKIDELYLETNRQSKVLDEILLCIKGSDSMNIEGVIPAQKRMTKELHELNIWKRDVSMYIGLVTSKKVWKFIGITIGIIALIIFSIKYGFHAAWQFIKGLFI